MTRTDPPYAADERTMLMTFLASYRETMIVKLEDLTEEQARWRPAPTANSLLSLVRHLVYVEHWWFHECFLGREPELPWEGDPGSDYDFVVKDEESIEQIIGLYRAHYERSDQIATEASLDDVAVHPKGAKLGVTMRWILVHMIEETARHAGHADITRELIDGKTGD